jgi:NADH:ubiquinone oxidoreductase subunit K
VRLLPTERSTVNLLTEPVGVAHYMAVGAVLFVCGAVCMATKRNALGILMGIELVLNGANVNFVAFSSRYLQADPNRALGLDGQLISLFVIVLAAAEAAVALAIALNFYNNFSTIDVDQADELQG